MSLWDRRPVAGTDQLARDGLLRGQQPGSREGHPPLPTADLVPNLAPSARPRASGGAGAMRIRASAAMAAVGVAEDRVEVQLDDLVVGVGQGGDAEDQVFQGLEVGGLGAAEAGQEGEGLRGSGSSRRRRRGRGGRRGGRRRRAARPRCRRRRRRQPGRRPGRWRRRPGARCRPRPSAGRGRTPRSRSCAARVVSHRARRRRSTSAAPASPTATAPSSVLWRMPAPWAFSATRPPSSAAAAPAAAGSATVRDSGVAIP